MPTKLFVGARLRRLRQQQGLNQAALAERLGLSLSYTCQLENNQRPVTAAVLLRISQAFQCDVSEFADGSDRRLVSELQVLFRDARIASVAPEPGEIGRFVEQMPDMAAAVAALYNRHLRLDEEYQQLVHRFYGEDQQPARTPLPHEEVRDFFNRRSNYIDTLDRAAEALAARLTLVPGRRVVALARELESRSGVTVRFDAAALRPDELRLLKPEARELVVSPSLSDGQQAFQIATQLALLAYGEVVDDEVARAGFIDDQSADLARHGLAHYFAGALLMPYQAVLETAAASRYDIEALQQRFHVGFESVCHRLSTIQRPGARGVPFYFVRVDQAGNISKRQSATSFHFAQQGGACPLWNVHEAFAQPGRILTQIAEMPDGTRFFGIARTVERGGGGFLKPRKVFAIGLGCEISHAHALVYADGLDLSAPRSAVYIGPGCRVCPRSACAQRAFPPLGKLLETDTNRESLISYRFRSDSGVSSARDRADAPPGGAPPRARASGGRPARPSRPRP